MTRCRHTLVGLILGYPLWMLAVAGELQLGGPMQGQHERWPLQGPCRSANTGLCALQHAGADLVRPLLHDDRVRMSSCQHWPVPH